MAHAALISELGQQLFKSVAGETKAKDVDGATKNRILQGLKDNRAPRTNQFEVSAKYAGLIEKFEIFSRDDLASALQSRLSSLNDFLGESKWTPELLSLLIELSDRPVEKTKLEDIEGQFDANDVSSITWKQIIADGPVDDSGLWDDIERGYHSSGDEGQAEDSESEHTTSSQATSVREDSIKAIARGSLVQPDNNGLDAIRQLHISQARAPCVESSSELDVIRETLSMLQGLPSRLYRLEPKNSRVALAHDTSIATASSAVVKDLMQQCTVIGTSLNALRRWTRSKQPNTYLQSCQASIQGHLKKFNLRVADIEQRYCAEGQQDLVVSIIATQSRLEELSTPLICLSALMQRATGARSADNFAVFDELFNQICITQMAGDGMTLSVLVDVFGAALKVYLRPVGRWISQGTLDARDQTFFVEYRSASKPAETLWHEHFVLRKAADGNVHALTLMQGLAPRVFAMGKNRAFLKALDASSEKADTSQPFRLPPVDSDSLIPFSQTLTEALSTWIDATSSDCTETLRSKILYDFGLLRMQKELEQVFCSSNGEAFQNFADALFWQMDHGSERWQSAFLLSELATNTLRSDSIASSASLRVSFERTSLTTSPRSPLDPIRGLSMLNLEYTYPRALQNVTKSETAGTHAKMFVLLLQIYRAKSALRGSLVDHRHIQGVEHSVIGPLSNPIATALRLRHDLTWLTDLLYSHITQTTSVLGQVVRKELEVAADIDAMAEAWATYERKLESSTIVVKNLSPIREAITGMLKMSLEWTREWERLVEDYRHAQRSQNLDQEDVDVDRAGDDEPVNTRMQRLAQQTMIKLKNNFDENLSFVAAGLRGIGRAGCDPAVEALAERLGWQGQRDR